MRIALVLVLLAACGGGLRTNRPTTGVIAGLARDHDSGDPVSKAEIRIRVQGDTKTHLATTTNDHGLYDLGTLRPGRYQLTAQFAAQPIDVINIDVRAGETTYVDIVFTLGRPVPMRINFGDTSGAIDRYRPTNLGASVGLIEGTVNDTGTRERVPGAVVTAVTRDHNQDELTEQTITDDHGRYRFEGIAPGTYSISAYYSVSGHGQIEVRRSLIEVAGAEAVIVPLWVELTR